MKLLRIDEFGGRLAHAAVALIGLAIYLFVSRTFNYRRAILSGAMLAASTLCIISIIKRWRLALDALLYRDRARAFDQGPGRHGDSAVGRCDRGALSQLRAISGEQSDSFKFQKTGGNPSRCHGLDE